MISGDMKVIRDIKDDLVVVEIIRNIAGGIRKIGHWLNR
jgi:hypothetical protein